MSFGSVVISGIVAMAVGFGAYAYQTGKLGGEAGGSPTAIVDTVAVKTDLLSMANAMKQQFALVYRLTGSTTNVGRRLMTSRVTHLPKMF